MKKSAGKATHLAISRQVIMLLALVAVFAGVSVTSASALSLRPGVTTQPAGSTPLGVPKVGEVCTNTSRLASQDCWRLPDSDRAGLAFSVRASSVNGDDIMKYTIRNSIDGLSETGRLEDGRDFAFALRAGDTFSLDKVSGASVGYHKLQVVAAEPGKRAPVDPEHPAVPKLGDVCSSKADPLLRGTSCWWVPAGHPAVAFAVRAATDPGPAGNYMEFVIKNKIDGLSATHVVKSGDDTALVLRAGDLLYLRGTLAVRQELEVVAVEEPSATALARAATGDSAAQPAVPAVGDSCRSTSVLDSQECWRLPGDHRAGLAFSVRASSFLNRPSDEVRYTIRNSIDGLAESGRIPVGQDKALAMRAGDTLSIDPISPAKDWRQLKVVSVAPITRTSVDTDHPAPPKLGDYCATKPDLFSLGINCWRVPEGHHPVAFALRATSDSATPTGRRVEFTIENQIDGLKKTTEMTSGQDLALVLRPGDVLKLRSTVQNHQELEVVAVQP